MMLTPMKKIILLFLLLLVFKEVYSQNTFQKTYGRSGDGGTTLQQTTDGGFIISGNSFNGMYTHIFLIKTNLDGDTLWTKIYGDNFDGFNNEGYSVQQTLDGGFIVTGFTNNFNTGSAVYLIKTNAIGDTLWTKTYGGGIHDVGQSVRQTLDGGCIILGNTSSFGAGSNGIYLIKTESNGNMLWSKTYSGAGGFSVQQTFDGGFIITGQTSFGAGGVDVYLLKTDADGVVLWKRTFGGTSDDRAFSVQQTEDRGFILVGETYSFATSGTNVYLIKADEYGILSWSKTFGGILGQGAKDVRQTADKGFIITGHSTGFGAGRSDVYLIKTDISGNLVWSKTFGGIENDQGNSVNQTIDGGYIIAGATASFNSDSGSYRTRNDVYLIKTDALGNSGCNETTPSTLQTNPFTIQGTPVTVETTPPTQVGSSVTFTGNNQPIQTNLCSNFVITRIEKTESSSSLVVYPNPTEGVFQVNYSSTEKSNLSLTVSDSNGKRIYRDSRKIFSGPYSKTIDLSKQSKGTYYIELITNGKKSVKKVILN